MKLAVQQPRPPCQLARGSHADQPVALAISPLAERSSIDFTHISIIDSARQSQPAVDRMDFGHNLTRISPRSSGVNSGRGRIMPGQKGPYTAPPGADLRQTRCGRSHFGNALPTPTMHDILGQCLTDLSVSPPLRQVRSSPLPAKSLLPENRGPSPACRRRRGGPPTRPWHSPWSPLPLPHWRISTRHTTKLRYPSRTAMPKQTSARPTKAPTGRWSSIPTCKAATRTMRLPNFRWPPTHGWPSSAVART